MDGKRSGPAMIVLVMGVSGTGKSTLGRRLAEGLAADFLEGDDFHPVHNIDKMQRGLPLDDQDRWPWLQRLNTELRARSAAGHDVVLACSALKAHYRACLAEGLAEPLHLVQLHGSPELLAARLAARQGHFMPPTLLTSQLAVLELASGPGVLEVDAAQPLEQSLAHLMACLRP